MPLSKKKLLKILLKRKRGSKEKAKGRGGFGGEKRVANIGGHSCGGPESSNSGMHEDDLIKKYYIMGGEKENFQRSMMLWEGATGFGTLKNRP